ncbi:efflux RND transporter permease subunit [Luteolibacter flavescens]|uniref:Efflux RND transporter permease subunit n=1 Tax=Luteolibacter flavescens TaxID=1859460 RepID=A0ABT3FKE8_9BACT|nr:efflux RND transporter permease subunit [Luteolibacter flavescens]MCW1883465.1 efflux RND transporter permease subunit [Luteolibacter flavescens]
MTTQFIRRPILSIVISILLVLVGLIALKRLPMSQFPNIAPPKVSVSVEYTGANAEVVMRSAILPLERAINGVPGMKYIAADVGNDGVGNVQVFFETGTDADMAAVNVQNRVSAVMGELPEEVVRNGVQISKEENAMLMYINISSTDPEVDEKFIYNFADIHVLAELMRVKGVGFADILGAKEYAMRVWLKPDKMLAYGVSADEVIGALQEQNVEAAPGKIGESADKRNPSLQYVVRYTGKFQSEEEFGAIPLRVGDDGEILKIRDVADVEFGTSYFDVEAKYNGRPSAAILLKQLPGSNAREVIARVKERMDEIKAESFLDGMDYEVSYDVSRFLDASVHAVVKTLVEAFLLVSLVTFIFLQDWRSTLIPVLAVPVSLIGAFLFVHFLGFSLNLITLFALVLAIGIVVDDAIVVVEAVHAKMHEGIASPRVATEMAMKEISGAIIAITMVMAAVFVPVAFLSGPAGVFFREFSLTMAVAIVLSGVVALTLTPALCSVFLKPGHGAAKPDRGPMGWFFRGFNGGYDRLSGRYRRLISWVAPRRVVTFGLLLLLCGGMALMGGRLPTGFIPNEDQGTFYISATTPSGATLERTKAVVDEIERSCRDIPAIKSISTLAGTNILSDGTGATYGTCLVNLQDWGNRKESVREVIEEVGRRIAHIKDASIEMFPPPVVPGYGNASGFEMRLLDKTGKGDLKAMEPVVQQFLEDLKARPEIDSAFTIFDVSFLEYVLRVDHDKAAKMGVTVSNAMSMLQTMLGSEYATNFIRFGMMYKVMVQALPEYRENPDELLKLTVKNDRDEMVELSTFITLEKSMGVDQITRYNLFNSAELNGEPAAGYSSGEAIRAIEETAREKLPRGYGIEWAGITYDQVAAGNQTAVILGISLIFVYLLLSAQYESFLLPMPVLLSLPAGLFGGFLFLHLAGLENNIYAQIAMVMLVGLLGKNGILIVEYAIMRQREGRSALDAAVEGAGQRLRPILMTSMAFVAGVIPLMLASGVGAVGNRTIGSTAVGGMLFGTFFGLIMVPGLYVIFSSLSRKFHQPEETPLSEEF